MNTTHRLRRLATPIVGVAVTVFLGACSSAPDDPSKAEAPEPVAHAALAVTTPGCLDSYVLVYQSSQLVWCVDPAIWAANGPAIASFFAYGDAMMTQIQSDFGTTFSGLPYTLVAHPDGLSEGVAGIPAIYPDGESANGVHVNWDAFVNNVNGITGFYGYLLPLHEMINNMTSAIGHGGWPTDWWADHRSPFPNSVDWHVLNEVGQVPMAEAQYGEWIPDGGSPDPQVGMFDQLLSTYGWPGFRRAFNAVLNDGMVFTSLKDPPAYTTTTPFVSGSPSALMSDYVIAYLSLGFGADVTGTMAAANVGEEPPNWDNNPPWQANYTLSPAEVGAVADAHCSLAAAAAAIGSTPGAAQTALAQAYVNLRAGDYAQARVPNFPGTCGAGCPTECGCQTSQNRCVAPWHASSQARSAPAVNVTESVYSQWQTGYCATVTVANQGPKAISAWSVTLGIGGTTVNTQWNANFARSGTLVTATNMSYNGSVAAGSSTTFGFCIAGTAPIEPPTIEASTSM